MTRSSLTYIPDFSVKFFFQPIYTDSGVENFVGQAQAQGFLNFLNPSPVSDLQSPNL
jgi:hypothetical protein